MAVLSSRRPREKSIFTSAGEGRMKRGEEREKAVMYPTTHPRCQAAERKEVPSPPPCALQDPAGSASHHPASRLPSLFQASSISLSPNPPRPLWSHMLLSGVRGGGVRGVILSQKVQDECHSLRELCPSVSIHGDLSPPLFPPSTHTVSLFSDSFVFLFTTYLSSHCHP